MNNEPIKAKQASLSIDGASSPWENSKEVCFFLQWFILRLILKADRLWEQR